MTRSIRTGLVVLGLLALADAPSVLTTDGEHPPMSVAIAVTLIGLAGLALIVPAWRGSRSAVRWLIGTRVLSAVSGLPALVADGVPGPIRALVVVGLLITAGAIALALPAARRAPLQPA